MAAPITRWLVTLFLVVLSIFVLNKVIVVNYLGSIMRAKVLRFQLSCFILCFISFIALYVWVNLSPLFDKNSTNNGSFLQSLRDIYTNPKSLFDWNNYTGLGKLWRAFLLFLVISTLSIYSTFVFLIGTEASRLALWFFTAWAIIVQLFSGLVLMNIISLVARLCLKQRSAKFTRVKSMIVVIYAFSIVSAGFYRAIYVPPEIKEVEIPVKDLPKSLDKLTVTLISDIHLGPTVGKATLEKVVHTVNYLNSDLVVIAGDLVDGEVRHLEAAVEPLSWLNSKYGVYFVTGNHEYYTTDVHNWFTKLKSLGVKVLHNSNVWLPAPDTRGLCLAGVDDPTADMYRFLDHASDLDKTLSGCEADKPTLLIAHQPATAKKALLSDHRVDLILSGHTHGGQMFPITIGAYLFNPFYAGLYRHGNYSHVYVTMGTVFWGFPIRFGTTSEITKITLVPWNL